MRLVTNAMPAPFALAMLPMLALGCDTVSVLPDVSSADASAADAGADVPPADYFVLEGAEADPGGDDLDPRVRIISDAEVIGIGEVLHTTGGQSAMRVRLMKRLIMEEGVRAIAVEAPRGNMSAPAFVGYVARCEGSLEQAVQAFPPIWWDVSTAEFLHWVCAWNQSHADAQVDVYGFDIRQPWFDRPVARAFFERRLPSMVALTDDLTRCFGGTFTSEEEFYTDPLTLSYYAGSPTPEADHAPCISAVERSLAVVEAARPMLVAAAGEREVELARLALRSLGAFETSIYELSRDRLETANPPRDDAMADVFLTMRRLDGARRTVLFAHNGHLERNSEQVIQGQFMGVRNMATQIDVEVDYVAVGQLALRVNYAWYTPATHRFNMPDSLEPSLNDLGVPTLLLDVDATTLIPAETSFRVGFDVMVPSRHYDALIFQQVSRANDYFIPPPNL